MAVIFDEKPMMPTRPRKAKTSLITSLILKTRLVKTEAGAQGVMVAITIVAFILMVMMAPDLFSSPTPSSNVPVNPNAYNMP